MMPTKAIDDLYTNLGYSMNKLMKKILPINRLDVILNFSVVSRKIDHCGNETENKRWADEHVKSISSQKSPFSKTKYTCVFVLKIIWFLIDDSNWYRWKSINVFYAFIRAFIHIAFKYYIFFVRVFSFIGCVRVCVYLHFQSANQTQYHIRHFF